MKSGFQDLDKLKSVDGIVAIISQRRSTGVLTFAVFKEFEQDGRPARTSFIPESLGESAEKMLQMARARIVEIKAFVEDYRKKNNNHQPTSETVAQFVAKDR